MCKFNELRSTCRNAAAARVVKSRSASLKIHKLRRVNFQRTSLELDDSSYQSRITLPRRFALLNRHNLRHVTIQQTNRLRMFSCLLAIVGSAETKVAIPRSSTWSVAMRPADDRGKSQLLRRQSRRSSETHRPSSKFDNLAQHH